MVALNTILLVGGIAAVGGAVVTVAVALLIVVYLTVRSIKKDVRDDDEDSGVYTLPLSALQGMSGGGRMPTQAEVDQVKAAIAQARGGAAVDDKKEAYVPGGYC